MPFQGLLSKVRERSMETEDPEPDHEWMEATGGSSVYSRLNPEVGLEDMKPYEWDSTTFDKIRRVVSDYLASESVRSQLLELARDLVIHRRQKCRDSRFYGLCKPGSPGSTFDERFHVDQNGTQIVPHIASMEEQVGLLSSHDRQAVSMSDPLIHVRELPRDTLVNETTKSVEEDTVPSTVHDSSRSTVGPRSEDAPSNDTWPTDYSSTGPQLENKVDPPPEITPTEKGGGEMQSIPEVESDIQSLNESITFSNVTPAAARERLSEDEDDISDDMNHHSVREIERYLAQVDKSSTILQWANTQEPDRGIDDSSRLTAGHAQHEQSVFTDIGSSSSMNIQSGLQDNEESEASDEGEEDSELRTEQIPPLVAAAKFLTDGQTFRVYKNNLERFVRGKLLAPFEFKAALETDGVDEAIRLLEEEPEAVTQPACPFEWIREPLGMGFTPKEIVDLIIEERELGPWICYDLPSLEEYNVDSAFHRNGCFHNSLEQGLRIHQQQSLKRETINRRVAELCGLGGVVPHCTAQSLWDGSVTFTGSSARVSYGARRISMNNLEEGMEIAKCCLKALCGAQAGQYAVVGVNATWVKSDSQTLKMQIVSKDLDLDFLEAPWGLIISICTGVAKKVPLREVIAETVVPIIAAWAKKPDEWEQLLTDGDGIVEELSKSTFRKWYEALQKAQREAAIEILEYVLSQICLTGFNNTGELVVACPTYGDANFCLHVRYEKNIWTTILKDSEDCATFACFTAKCIQTEDRKCRNSDQPTWEDEIPVLVTSVCQYQWLKTNGWSKILQKKSLQYGKNYWMGCIGDERRFIASQYPRPSGPTLLKISKSMCPDFFFRRAWGKPDRMRAHYIKLQERRMVDEEAAEDVFVLDSTR
ncbi:hypothetical protein KCU93_g10302, partial [Aureobasidium melanogenum]